MNGRYRASMTQRGSSADYADYADFFLDLLLNARVLSADGRSPRSKENPRNLRNLRTMPLRHQRPIAQTWPSVRMMMRPSEIAGEAMITSFIGFLASSTYSRPAWTTKTSPSSLARYSLPSAGDRRCGERTASAHARPVELLSGLRVVRRQDAVVVQRVQLIAIHDRGRDVGAVAVVAPRDRVAGRAAGASEISPRAAGPHGIDRTHRRIARRDDREIAMHDGRADRRSPSWARASKAARRSPDRSRAPSCHWSRARRLSVRR